MRLELKTAVRLAVSVAFALLCQTEIHADDPSGNQAASTGSGSSATGRTGSQEQQSSTTTTTTTTSVESNSSTSRSSSSTSSSSSTNRSTSQAPDSLRIPSGPPTPSSPGTYSESWTEKSIKFIPKFKQRISDLGDQIRMAQSKGFITDAESAQFIDRQAKLFSLEAEASKKAFPKADLDELEKTITLLNADLFKAMHKSNPVKAGPAEKEVNDPNLIPAYPDPELQAGSGKK